MRRASHGDRGPVRTQVKDRFNVTSIHEAGHAVVAAHIQLPFRSVTINHRLGVVMAITAAGVTYGWPLPDLAETSH